MHMQALIYDDKESSMQAVRNIRAVSRSLLCSVVMLGVSGVAAADLTAPEISIAGIHSPTFSSEGVQLICTVRVGNPNAIDLPLMAADINLKLADTPAAKGRLLKAVTVPSRRIQNVDLLVDVTMSAAASWLPMYFEGQAFTLPFEVDGYVDVDHAELGRVPFHETGDVSMTGDGLEVQAAN
jgi:LEA14-like dessication related protein